MTPVTLPLLFFFTIKVLHSLIFTDTIVKPGASYYFIQESSYRFVDTFSSFPFHILFHCKWCTESLLNQFLYMILRKQIVNLSVTDTLLYCNSRHPMQSLWNLMQNAGLLNNVLKVETKLLEVTALEGKYKVLQQLVILLLLLMFVLVCPCFL